MRVAALLAAGVTAGLALFLLVGQSERAGESEVELPPEPERAGEAERTEPVQELEGRSASDPGAGRVPEPRETVAVPDDPSPPAEAPGSELRTLRGLVLALDGTPIAGVGVELAGQDPPATTESDGLGRFELAVAPLRRSRELAVADPAHATIRSARVHEGNLEREHVLLAAPAVDLAGIVTDPAGVGIEAAPVRVRVDEGFRRTFPLPLDATVGRRYSTETDAAGRFRLERVPSPSEPHRSELVADAEGFLPARIPVPARSTDDLRIELEPAVGEAGVLVEGIVLLPPGHPADGALVRTLDLATETGPDGRFALPLERRPPEEAILAATLDGFGPAVHEDLGRDAAALWPHAPPFVELVLGSETLAIAGRVVESEAAGGGGLPGWRVLLAGTEIEHGRVPPVLVEPDWLALTEPDGSFRFDGLVERTYDLRAYSPDTLLMIESEPVAAGREDVLLLVPPDLLHPRVAGVVVGLDGTPLPNITVGTRLTTYVSGGARSFESGAETLTDARGLFELHDVPRRHVQLHLSGESILPKTYDLSDPDQPTSTTALVPTGTDVEDLVLPAPRRCHFRLIVETSSHDDLAFRLEDAEGRSLSIFQISGTGWSSSSQRSLGPGSSELFAASDEARWLVVLAKVDGEMKELVRREVSLDPSKVSEQAVEVP